MLLPLKRQVREKLCTSVFLSHLCLSSSFSLAIQHFADINGIEPEMVVPTGPFRNVGLSKAAQTHKLRKLRSPSKCRECDSYVYFQGAECEEVRSHRLRFGLVFDIKRAVSSVICSLQCFLACHKRCLETLAIQCGHKKLQGRLQLFGQDFSQVSGNSPDGIPFIIKKCIGEIERRALRMKVRSDPAGLGQWKCRIVLMVLLSFRVFIV